jgi:hypothetical protein
LARSARFARVKKYAPGDNIHLEAARKPPLACIRYCKKTESKSGPFVSFGEDPQGQGHRSDLDQLQESIDSCSPMLRTARISFGSFVRYHRGLYAYAALVNSQPRDFKSHVSVLYGTPGTGKSRKAMELGGPDAFWLPPSTQQHVCWWDGYDGQECVVIDDFYGWIRWSELLQLFDRYPCRVRTQSGSVNFVAKRIILTSNRHPGQWYHHANYEEEALRRRIDYVEAYGTRASPLGKVTVTVSYGDPTATGCLQSWHNPNSIY